MSDFESIEGSGLSEETEQALENEAEDELERLLYRDERRFLKESQKKKKLKREIERESLERLERLARTEDDFKEVEKQWDRLEENADRRFRYHETVRGDVPLEYGMAEDSPVIPAFLNSFYWSAILKGRYLDILFDCPFEIQENITNAFIHELLKELKDEYKELLTFRLIRRYSTTQTSFYWIYYGRYELKQTKNNFLSQKAFYQKKNRCQRKNISHIFSHLKS